MGAVAPAPAERAPRIPQPPAVPPQRPRVGKDQRPRTRLDELDRRFRPYVEALIREGARRGIAIAITDARRTFRQQRELRRRFKAGDARVLAAARPGWSFHEYGLAIDVHSTPAGTLGNLGVIGEALGLRWGGRFGDPVHFDAGRFITIAQARREAGLA